MGEGAEATDLIEELRQWGVHTDFPKLGDQFNKVLLLSAWTAQRKVIPALLATKAVDLNAAAGCGFTALQLAACWWHTSALWSRHHDEEQERKDVEGDVRAMGRRADDVEGGDESSCGRCGRRR